MAWLCDVVKEAAKRIEFHIQQGVRVAYRETELLAQLSEDLLAILAPFELDPDGIPSEHAMLAGLDMQTFNKVPLLIYGDHAN